nr:hypothetical protein [Treponema sp.]
GSGGGNENETDWNSIPVSSYLPIYVNGNSYTFIFVPTDYWVTYDGSQHVTVRGEYNGWSADATQLQWDSSAKFYTATVTIEDLGAKPRYKFYCPEEDKWFGGADYRGTLPEGYTQTDGNYNLLFPSGSN